VVRYKLRMMECCSVHSSTARGMPYWQYNLDSPAVGAAGWCSRNESCAITSELFERHRASLAFKASQERVVCHQLYTHGPADRLQVAAASRVAAMQKHGVVTPSAKVLLGTGCQQ
jgi:hypothetical protein